MKVFAFLLVCVSLVYCNQTCLQQIQQLHSNNCGQQNLMECFEEISQDIDFSCLNVLNKYYEQFQNSLKDLHQKNKKTSHAEIIINNDRDIVQFSQELEKVNQMENVESLNITVACDCTGTLDFQHLDVIPTLKEFTIQSRGTIGNVENLGFLYESNKLKKFQFLCPKRYYANNYNQNAQLNWLTSSLQKLISLEEIELHLQGIIMYGKSSVWVDLTKLKKLQRFSMELENVNITQLRMYNLKKLETFELIQHGGDFQDLDFLLSNIKGCDNLKTLYLSVFDNQVTKYLQALEKISEFQKVEKLLLDLSSNIQSAEGIENINKLENLQVVTIVLKNNHIQDTQPFQDLIYHSKDGIRMSVNFYDQSPEIDLYRCADVYRTRDYKNNQNIRVFC